MALSISPRHDVLAHSPHSHFTVLPDLPYASTSRTHRSPAVTGAQPSLSPASHALAQTVSAPTSPLSRPVMMPLSRISPMELPRVNGSRPQQSPVTPQQMAQYQATQALAAQQSYFPPVPVRRDRVSPPTSSTPLGQAVSVRPAPLSSTNLAALSGTPNGKHRMNKGKARVSDIQHDEPGSGSETERERGGGGGGSDSDATVIDHRRVGKASYSQTDIAALRKRVTQPAAADAGAVGGGTVDNTKFRNPETITLPRPPIGRKTPPKTPPNRPLPLLQQQHAYTTGGVGVSGPGPSSVSPGKSPRSKSHTSLASMRRSPTTSPKQTFASLRRSPNTSPRGSSFQLSPLTPVTPHEVSPISLAANILRGEAASSDADGEDESQTDDSSVSFHTKRTTGLRRRSIATSTSGLGLSLGQGDQDPRVDLGKNADDPLIADAIERLYQSSSLLYLRILAILPACWGTAVLLHALVAGSIRHDVWPWGVDFSREALYRLSHGDGAGEDEGIWRRAVRGDLILCIAWAILTGHFCFRFTTGLTYRWRSYYDLLPVLVRLLALQALCWPATYITLSFLGPSQPLFAWAVIGVSTGITYAVIMWLASNVLPDDRHSPSRSRTPTRRNSNSNNDPAPRPVVQRRRRVFPEWGEALLISPPVPPAHLSWWDKLNYKRRWDWDAVAREVGWKVGALLLVTSAWVFWQIHLGWLVRPDHLF